MLPLADLIFISSPNDANETHVVEKNKHDSSTDDWRENLLHAMTKCYEREKTSEREGYNSNLYTLSHIMNDIDGVDVCKNYE